MNISQNIAIIKFLKFGSEKLARTKFVLNYIYVRHYSINCRLTLSDSSFSTSFFTLLNMKGFRIM